MESKSQSYKVKKEKTLKYRWNSVKKWCSRDNKNYEYIIVDNLENVTELDCAKYDQENDQVYRRLLKKASKAEESLRNSALSQTIEVPVPPKPGNQERFLIWRKRNQSISVIPQSEAVLFLHSFGYKLNVHYEAYQALDLAKEVRYQNGIQEDSIDLTQNFDRLYTDDDKNILRRKSMYGKQVYIQELRGFNNNSSSTDIIDEHDNDDYSNNTNVSDYRQMRIRRQTYPKETDYNTSHPVTRRNSIRNNIHRSNSIRSNDRRTTNYDLSIDNLRSNNLRSNNLGTNNLSTNDLSTNDLSANNLRSDIQKIKPSAPSYPNYRRDSDEESLPPQYQSDKDNEKSESLYPNIRKEINLYPTCE